MAIAERNHRRNQQDGEYRPKIWGGVNGDIESEWEEHTVRLWTDADFVGIQLDSCPLRGDGIPSIILARRVGMVDTVLTEVDIEIDLDTGQFSVDYEEVGSDGTGRIFFSPGDLGATIIVKRYAGTGRILKDSEDLFLNGTLTLGGVIQDTNGVPVAGFMVRDGETVPYYAKEVDFTFETDGSTSFAHGISNAYTNNRIFFATIRDLETNGNQNYNVTSIDWNDSDMTVAAIVGAARDATALIFYFADA